MESEMIHFRDVKSVITVDPIDFQVDMIKMMIQKLFLIKVVEFALIQAVQSISGF